MGQLNQDVTSSAPLNMVRRGRQLAIIILFAVVFAAICSHLLVGWLKIKVARTGYKYYGATDQAATIILHGSSVAYAGIDWHKVSELLGKPITSWASFGSTPSEWDQAPPPTNEVGHVFIVVSTIDLNEYFLSDYRADIVPLMQTVKDLKKVKMDLSYRKIVLGQYPIKALRVFFPTVGRSDGVMVGVREQLKKIIRIIRRGKTVEISEPKPEGGLELEEKLSDWTPGRLKRQLVLTEAACQGKHAFNGLKMLAMMRLFEKALTQGEVTWVVLPASPSYQKEFLTASVREDFEKELDLFRRAWPKARLIRLDLLPSLQDDAMFADLAHINRHGQEIATAALLSQMNILLIHP